MSALPARIETPKFAWPNATQRTVVIGRTGSGKTQFAAYTLLQQNFNQQPWVIINYKYDKLLDSIPGVRDITLNELPKYPGLYQIHPMPHETDAVERWLWKVWHRERIGILADEAYNLPDKGALQAVLTQGRSKHIPAIICTQRPCWLSRFIFSEADHYALFHLNDVRDRKTVAAFYPLGTTAGRDPKFYARWYDVAQDQLFLLQPVPDAASILQSFADKSARRRRAI